MKQETAEQVHSILKEIESIKENITWLSQSETVLCFGTKSSGFNATISVSEYRMSFAKEILDKHHKMIIQELEDKLNELKKQIEEL